MSQKAGSKERQARLAAALRDNLRRRKAAHRPERGDPTADAPTEAPGPDDAAPRPVDGR
jgi:hypothetical protein